MLKLDGKVAVVTGASKGIGAAIARTFATEGAKVVVNYASSRDGAESVVAAIARDGGAAIAVGGDVAKAAEVEALFEKARRAFGPVDILVNNAGVYAMGGLDQLTEAAFHRHFNVNVLGLLLASKAFAAQCEGGGGIINIGSLVSRNTPPGFVVYNATKGAVDAISRTLARELGPRHIRVNAISPGVVETEGTRATGVLGGPFEKQAIAMTPLGRIGLPDDIACVAAFLASEDARWISGEIIYASGGM